MTVFPTLVPALNVTVAPVVSVRLTVYVAPAQMPSPTTKSGKLHVVGQLEGLLAVNTVEHPVPLLLVITTFVPMGMLMTLFPDTEPALALIVCPL